jgi:hypothetical protein
VKETNHQVKLQQAHWAALSHPAKLEIIVTYPPEITADICTVLNRNKVSKILVFVPRICLDQSKLENHVLETTPKDK